MRFLVTAGPTREPLDPVRYLSNRSSGKMGYAIAEAAREAGHETTLISGPVALAAPAGVRMVRVETAEQMLAAVHAHAAGADVLVMCAAVADFRPAREEPQKIKKEGRAALTLELVATPDILLSLRDYPWPDGQRPIIVAFAAETRDLSGSARKKLREKNCDLVVGNDVSRADIGFENDANELVLHFRDGGQRTLPRAQKRELATILVEIFANLEKRS